MLLLGATGTGKELFATQIHELSTPEPGDGARELRGDSLYAHGKRVVRLRARRLYRCGRTAIGRFELANHSTIFLDEIGDLPSDVKIKLLRVIEERRIERLGGRRALM